MTTTKKPAVKLVGTDGNVFNLIGLTGKALIKAGTPEKATEFTNKAFAADSYGAVLNLISEYCTIR